MSQQIRELTAEQKAAEFERLANSPAGELLLQWIGEEVINKRRTASRLEPTAAWGQLQFADGLQRVADHISAMRSLPTIGKRQ